ncbi:tRNA-guanine transglycosylase [Coleofasciculus sp. FACHB-64]|uniref:tRNA-guanine transglycosylase n=1 Tax=Cyanophyceae TaxID=3028117 RepID=UPI001688A67E|nr:MULTISPECIES: tRNA-guanine transglycosylase [unclassified Coleofasciculus]MBD1837898.1 tRNA-guanine transglycosylase [Coleofasciculus sp. FACHB-501]MBD2044519.1 tRNA-guanine transglycosylase [Coleofasciculus sp. FACHB-64]
MFSTTPFKHGRIGNLYLSQTQTVISTPCLFPVVCLVTGTTARGGGLWKYVLQTDESNGLLRREEPVPLMSQVLHFLDFIPNRPHELDKWRKRGIKQRYMEEVNLKQFASPLFLDSGGFKLLWNKSVNLSAYDLSIENGKGSQTILELQREFNGDIVATLDYPLPPGLAQAEAEERMQKSIENAVSAALELRKRSDYKPFLYVAAHGQNRDSMGRYVKQVFDRFQAEDLKDYRFGLAVGSLVPLRGSHKFLAILSILQGLQENIPEERRAEIPIHVFGVTGNIVPLLAYLGVDSFDSSTYVQETRSLSYINPATGRTQPVLEMEKLTCDCRVCKQANLEEIQNALTSEIRGRPQASGHYKSKYYGDIALHNLEMDFRIVDETKKAIEANLLQDYLIRHTEKFSQLRPVLGAIAQEDESLQVRLSRTIISMPRQLELELDRRVISLNYNSEDFNILTNGYRPQKGKRVLLIIPCSGGKPYSKSRSHRLIAERLEQGLGEKTKLIQKVTLSGLYGLVPEEYEQEEAILGYDFRLEAFNKEQIALVTDRLVTYLERHSGHYVACIGYATSSAYRTVLEQAAKKVSCGLQVLPVKPKTRRMTEFFRKENLAELVEQLRAIFDIEE